MLVSERVIRGSSNRKFSFGPRFTCVSLRGDDSDEDELPEMKRDVAQVGAACFKSPPYEWWFIVRLMYL